jgi:hypothetical protein
MTGATHPQLPKYVTKAITFTKKDLSYLWKWEKKLANKLRELLDIPKNLTLRIFQIHK